MGKQAAATKKVRYRVGAACNQAEKGEVFVCFGHVSCRCRCVFWLFLPIPDHQAERSPRPLSACQNRGSVRCGPGTQLSIVSLRQDAWVQWRVRSPEYPDGSLGTSTDHCCRISYLTPLILTPLIFHPALRSDNCECGCTPVAIQRLWPIDGGTAALVPPLRHVSPK